MIKLVLLASLCQLIILQDIKLHFCLLLVSKNQPVVKEQMKELVGSGDREKVHKFYFLLFNNCIKKLIDFNEKEVFHKIEGIVSKHNLVELEHYLILDSQNIKLLQNPLQPVERQQLQEIFDFQQQPVR